MGALRHMTIVAWVACIVWFFLGCTYCVVAFCSDCCDTVLWAEWKIEEKKLVRNHFGFYYSSEIWKFQTKSFISHFAPNHFHSGSLAMWWLWSENQQGQLKFRIVEEEGEKSENISEWIFKSEKSHFEVSKGAARNHLYLFIWCPLKAGVSSRLSSH